MTTSLNSPEEFVENVIDIPLQYAEKEISEIPVLQRFSKGNASLSDWKYYMGHRMRVAMAGDVAESIQQYSPFEQLFASAARQASILGYSFFQKACKENLAEERGIGPDGAVDLAQKHSTWREKFRLKIFAALQQRGASQSELEIETPTQEAVEYQRFLETTAERMNTLYTHEFWFGAGALMALEATLKTEFQAISTGIRRDFPELNSHDALYVNHHAGHEDRHKRQLIEGAALSLPLGNRVEMSIARSNVYAGIIYMARFRIAMIESFSPSRKS